MKGPASALPTMTRYNYGAVMMALNIVDFAWGMSRMATGIWCAGASRNDTQFLRRDGVLDIARKPQGRSNLRESSCKFFSRGPIDTAACDRDVSDTANAICFCKIKAQRRERMHNQAKQPNIPAELADNLINSLSGLTAIEGDELRRQVIMLLIDHSYALGYVAGANAGIVARMQSRLPAPRPQSGAGYQTGVVRYPRAPGYDLS